MNPRTRWATACHESGHIVAAHVLGFVPIRAAILAARGLTDIDFSNSPDDHFGDAVVSACGALAEQLADRVTPWTAAATPGDLLASLDATDEASIQRYVGDSVRLASVVESRATRLIAQHADIVLRIAGELYRRGSLDRHALAALLGTAPATLASKAAPRAVARTKPRAAVVDRPTSAFERFMDARSWSTP